MSEHRNNVAVIVHSCDRYELLFRGFEYFFSKYWDFNIKCSYYFITECLSADIQGFKNLKSGRGPWSERLHRVLTEQVSEKYILYFQEDMWMDKWVDKTFFEELFKLAEQKEWTQVKLHSSDVYVTRETENFLNGFNIAIVDNQKSDYLMSHQITLWKRSFLVDQLLKNEHPWRNERRGTKRLRTRNPQILHIDYFAENGQASINHNKQIIFRSQYYCVSHNGTINDSILHFVDELSVGDKAYGDKLFYHYQQKLTHDGKAKPRKQDIFKRLKTWLLS
ncbi:hypothetical protein [Dyadobacter crusticola]|uniref:hypothetical protein n=1 Tax=Dyadobacter crusticola TaxID=292407 RepID=UPI0004E1B745|nr:hypothetical protein [Dyadobacter crusticola]